MAVTLLHLSDVHFGMRDDRGDQDRITSALVDAVRKDEWCADICVFSGDLSFSGDTAQFADGEKWLRALLNVCSSSHLFIVPGNHDVVRDDFKLVWSDAYQDLERYRGSRSKLQSSSGHLRAFQEWHATFKMKWAEP